jgi:hypothetical protein
MLTLAIARGAVPAAPAGHRTLEPWTTRAGEVFATPAAGGGQRRVDWAGVGTFICADDEDQVEAWLEPSAFDTDAIAAFDRAVHPALLQTRRGYQALHASAALVDGSVVGFCGRSGAGKSTIARAFRRSGCTQFSDDALAMAMTDPIAAVALPFTPRLRQPSAAHFSALSEPVAPARPRQAPLRAVVLLHRTSDSNREPHLDRVPATSAFHELLTHAHCFDPRDPTESTRLVEDFLRLAQTIDVYTLHFASGLDRLPSAINATVSAIARDAVRSPMISHVR